MHHARISRRRFGQAAGSVLAASLAGGGCRALRESAPVSVGRLTARPLGLRTTWSPGTHPLGLENARDAVLHVPANAGEAPLPLIVLLHGAGGSGEPFLRRLRATAEAAGLAILAPDSRGRTWDAIQAEHQSLIDVVTSQRHFSGFGPDVLFLDRALERVFRKVAVDPERITLGGFSDGATYALSLGLINGDLFRRIVAFSPGFVVGGEARGRPEIFVSHGRADSILPIDRCSRRIVGDLRKRGYAIAFREFDGGHDVPEVIAREAMRWAADRGVIGGQTGD
jgi:phospholipase/carboxylesterase